jgi:serine protease Do
MKIKYAPALLAIIALMTSSALAQRTTPAPAPPPPDTEPNVYSFFVEGSGFLGVHTEEINRDNMARYGLNQVRGVGVTDVVKDSPAEKAGIRKDDVIVRFDGENVTSVRKLNRLISEVAPDQTVRVAISRGGAEQELSATIARRRNAFSNTELFGNMEPKVWSNIEPRTWSWSGNLGDQENGLVFALGNRRRIGITTTDLTKQLADYFGIADGHGVLVTSVTEGGPAATAGLKAGDVITAVDGEKVDETGDISNIVNRKKEGDVTLTVVRNRSQQTIRVTPKEGDRGVFRTITRPAVGRTIAIPRIQIPELDITVPAIEMGAVEVPAIEVPAVEIPAIEIPSINISNPRVVTPRITTPRVVTPRIMTPRVVSPRLFTPRVRIVWTPVGPI